jgi:multiple sugar transport system permease protein
MFISPWIIGFLVFILYPFLASLYYSMTSYHLRPGETPNWVGLENYRQLFQEDTKFPTAILNTLIYTLMAAPIGMILALMLALLYNQPIPGRSLMRALIYVPLIVPPVASTILWMWIFNAKIGLFNAILSIFGIHGPAWLNDPSIVKFSLVIMAQWGVGGNVVLLLAALADVPRHLYEAAEIDGANTFQKFLNITIPMLSPTLLFIIIMNIIYSLQYFTEAYIVSGGTGGPITSTLFYSLYLFQQAFVNFNMGYASAMAWILFIISLLATLVVLRVSTNRVNYDRI